MLESGIRRCTCTPAVVETKPTAMTKIYSALERKRRRWQRLSRFNMSPVPPSSLPGGVLAKPQGGFKLVARRDAEGPGLRFGTPSGGAMK